MPETINLYDFINQMKKDNVYTPEVEAYIENYCKFYVEDTYENNRTRNNYRYF